MHARSRRAGITATEVLAVVVALVVLAFAISTWSSRLGSRRTPRRVICASNVRSLMQSMYIYANDNAGMAPVHYFETASDESPPGYHGVAWVGTMGSTDSLRISQATSPTVSSNRSHPSRSLFVLITGGQSTPGQFICPESGDTEDTLRNYGPDAADGVESAAQPGRDRFDFSGYNSLSYATQLPFGPAGREPKRARPLEKLDVRLALVADKGPYTTDGGPGLAGTRTRRDKLSGLAPPNWTDAQKALNAPPEDWRAFNSRNHGGEGQSVGYADGHAEFQRRPIAGADNDNIYTFARDAATPLGFINGYLPQAFEPLGPVVQTDSFLVP